VSVWIGLSPVDRGASSKSFAALAPGIYNRGRPHSSLGPGHPDPPLNLRVHAQRRCIISTDQAELHKKTLLPLESVLAGCTGTRSVGRDRVNVSDVRPLRTIRDAFAVHPRLSDPRVVPCFRCAFLLGMQSSTTIGCLCPFPSPMALAFAEVSTARHSQVPPSSASDGTLIFAASLVRYSLRPVELLASLADLTGYFSQPTEAFTPGLPRIGHPLRRRV
jgi:hypothetical protein